MSPATIQRKRGTKRAKKGSSCPLVPSFALLSSTSIHPHRKRSRDPSSINFCSIFPLFPLGGSLGGALLGLTRRQFSFFFLFPARSRLLPSFLFLSAVPVLFFRGPSSTTRLRKVFRQIEERGTYVDGFRFTSSRWRSRSSSSRGIGW